METTSMVMPFILKSGVKILYPEGNEKMQRNAQFLADYLKTATGKDFSIEAGTEGKNAIVLALGSEVENPESYQLKVTDHPCCRIWLMSLGATQPLKKRLRTSNPPATFGKPMAK